jgi:signal transduction histidine kinase
MTPQTSLRRWWVNLPIGYKGLLVIALPVLGLVATFVVRLPLSAQQQETAALVARTAEMRGRAQELMIALLNAETGARGFALTGDRAFLAPFDDAQARVPVGVEAVRVLVASAEERASFAQVESHARRRLQLAGSIVALAQQGVDAADPRVVQLLAQGKTEMDACRASVETLLEAQEALATSSEADLERVQRRLAPIVWITFIGGFVSAAAAMWLFATGIARRMGAVEQNAERLARGERLRPAPARGRDEIGRLDHALRRAAVTIRLRDRELRSLNATLERSLHEQQILNRELEAFSYSVSHDLRAPLRSIDGFAQALREDWGDRLDEAGQDHLARVRNAAQRMGRLIDDLLKLSRLSRAQVIRVDVDLSQIARDIAGELEDRNPTRHVVWRIDDNLRARCDPSLARIVLENLLGNAWKFTSKTREARIEFMRAADTSPATFVVRDNGAGFDMRFADKLFAPFQRLHGEREFPGTGIGLATVQRIVHKHGGEVRTRAEIGRGASFSFTLEPADGVAAA